MNSNTWTNFTKVRSLFKQEADEILKSLPKLKQVQQNYADNRSETTYKIETPVVYNTALDEITIKDDIKLILVADNPGRREQAAENRKYLVGPSGKIAHKFFRDNPSLEIDYLKNVIILNKTPIHSARTNELKELCRMYKSLPGVLDKSQEIMADLLLKFHLILNCPVWITGYSEMRKSGIFEVYTEKLKELCKNNNELNNNIFIFRHFSMNQFTIDLKRQSIPEENVLKNLKRIGKTYKEKILSV